MKKKQDWVHISKIWLSHALKQNLDLSYSNYSMEIHSESSGDAYLPSQDQ